MVDGWDGWDGDDADFLDGIVASDVNTTIPDIGFDGGWGGGWFFLVLW